MACISLISLISPWYLPYISHASPLYLPCTSVPGAAAELWRADGVGGFYSSYGSNYAYSTPVDVIKFLLYEQVKGLGLGLGLGLGSGLGLGLGFGLDEP